MFVASGAGVFVVFVEKHLSSLQQLARNSIVDCLSHYEDNTLEDLHLPPHLKKFVACALQPTITVGPTFLNGETVEAGVIQSTPVISYPYISDLRLIRMYETHLATTKVISSC